VLHEGKHLADLGPGDFFGEIALLAEHRRTATVTATSDLRIVVMHERDFRVMEDQMPDVAAKIRSVMSDRREEHRARTGEDA
jgi:voltage-gated potassium channel